MHRDSRNCHVRVGVDVGCDQLLEVHAEQLVARQDQDVLDAVFFEEAQLLANRVRRSLVPVRAAQGLLCRQNLDETVVEQVEVVCLANVPVQTDGVELRQDIHPVDVTVDAVGNRNVNQSVFATQRDRRL